MSHATRGLVAAPNLDFADAAKLHLLLDRLGAVGDGIQCLGKLRPSRSHGSAEINEDEKVVRFRKGEGAFHQPRLQVFLNALLTEEASRVRHTVLAPSEDLAGHLEVVVRLLHPFTRDREESIKPLVDPSQDYDPARRTSRVRGALVAKVEAPPGSKIAWFSAGGSFTASVGATRQTRNAIA